MEANIPTAKAGGFTSFFDNIGCGIIAALLSIRRFTREHEHKQQRRDCEVFVSNRPKERAEVFRR